MNVLKIILWHQLQFYSTKNKHCYADNNNDSCLIELLQGFLGLLCLGFIVDAL